MVGEITLDQITKAIANGSLDEKILSRTLEELKFYSHSYLYNLQKDTVKIDKFRTVFTNLKDESDDVFSGDINRSYKSFNIPKSFIHHDLRLKFRHNKYFNKPLDNVTINKNRDVFIYNYLVFIDGNLDLSARIKCHEDLSFICLNREYMNDDTASKFKEGATIDVLFLKNSYFINKETSRVSLIDNNFKYNIGTTIEPNSVIIAYIHKDGSSIRSYEAEYNEGFISLPKEVILPFNDLDKIKLELLVVRDFSERFDCPKGTKFIQHKLHNMPLPKDNTLIFVKNSDNTINIDCSNDFVTEKYPNIMELKDNTNDMVLYTLYHDDPVNEKMVFDRGLGVYAKLINLLERYGNNTVPDKLAGYDPMKYIYDLSDYNKGDVNQKCSPLVYKVNKINSIFKLWAMVLELYKVITMEDYNGFYLDLKGKDLVAKERNDNFKELVSAELKEQFTETRYLFIYRSEDNSKLPYKFYLDGVFYNPDKLYVENGYQYVYIEKSKIKPDSIIEIERFRDLSFEIPIEIKEDKTPLRFPSDDIECPFSSVFLVDWDGNYISESDCAVYMNINGVDTKLGKEDTITVSNKSNLFIKRENVNYNKMIHVMCNDIPTTFDIEIGLEDSVEGNLNKINGIHHIKTDPERIRIFKRGRLIPFDKYIIAFPSNFHDNIKIGLNYDRFINSFSVDYIPDKYKMIYSVDTIPPNGLINLVGIINKPFNLKYYDVFLNGFRLNKNQVEKISNFTIALKNVKTNRKLVIYERVLSKDFYGFDNNVDLLSDTLLRDDPEFMKGLTNYLTDIEVDPTITDVDSMFDVIGNLILNLISEYLAFNFIDCNNNDIPDDIYNKYKTFFKNSVFFINPQETYDSDKEENIVYFLSPEKSSEIRYINDNYYVKEFTSMMDTFVTKYLDANIPVSSTVKNTFRDIFTKDSTVILNGNLTTNRDGNSVTFLDANLK